MGATYANLNDPWIGDSQSVRVAKVNGSFVKKVELDIVDNSHMNHGWDSAGGIDVALGGAWTGKRTLWDYTNFTTLSSVIYPLSIAQDSISGWFGSTYTKTRDGGTYKIKHKSNSGNSPTSNSDSYPNAPKPTFSLTIGNDGVISLLKNTTYTYEDWFRTAEAEACAQKSITVYKQPYVGDQTMTVTSSTTPNMYYPENGSQFVILKQPSIYASVGITDTDDGSMALTSYSSISPLIGSGFTYDYFVKIIAYKPDWDSLSDIQMSWDVTGAKASQCSAQSGTITNFADIPNATGGWVDYAVGYFPFTYSMGGDLAGSPLNFNVVANGLKFNSGTQTKTVNALG